MTLLSKSLLERAGGSDALEAMLRDFYGRARGDDTLGRIFNSRVDDWEYHIQKVVAYWRRQTHAPPEYQRTFPSRHAPLGLRERHFRAWLQLFRETADQHFTAEVAVEIGEIARRVAVNLYRHIASDQDVPVWLAAPRSPDAASDEAAD